MDDIKKNLLHFLKTDSLKVAALKGEWGIGKTYFWRQLISDHLHSLNFKAYSYVSLFGVKNSSDLKKLIFTNFELLDDKKVKKQLEKYKPLSTLIKSAKIPYLNSSAGAFIDYFENKFINNFLICFDDLERKEGSISASSILGCVFR